jgi:hypothetical protein
MYMRVSSIVADAGQRDKRDKHSVAGDEERLFRASEKEKQAPDLREDEKRR